MVEWGQKFLGAGEAFLGEEVALLRKVLADNTARHFDAFHRGNMEVGG